MCCCLPLFIPLKELVLLLTLFLSGTGPLSLLADPFDFDIKQLCELSRLNISLSPSNTLVLSFTVEKGDVSKVTMFSILHGEFPCAVDNGGSILLKLKFSER